MEMKMTNFSTLADEYANLKAQIEAQEAQLKKLRAKILATGQEFVVGERSIVQVSLSERNSLDTAGVKQLLTAEQVVALTKTTVIETLKVKPKL